MKRVFATGAAGFIGSRTASGVAGRGDKVLAIDDFSRRGVDWPNQLASEVRHLNRTGEVVLCLGMGRTREAHGFLLHFAALSRFKRGGVVAAVGHRVSGGLDESPPALESTRSPSDCAGYRREVPTMNGIPPKGKVVSRRELAKPGMSSMLLPPHPLGASN